MRRQITIKSVALFVAALIISAVCTPQAIRADTSLSADTSRPESSTFALGEPVQIAFSATGLAASSQQTLTVNVVDEFEHPVTQWSAQVVADSNGSWSGSWSPPSTKLGFYRVFGKLSDGTQISGLGSRPAGYITYCIVPDPARRIDVGEADTHFGMQGGFNPNVNILPYLGIRWVLGGYAWNTLEPNYSGELLVNILSAQRQHSVFPARNSSTEFATYNGKPWRVYTIPSLYYPPQWATTTGAGGEVRGLLTSDGALGWKNFCTNAAKLYASNYPYESQHLYQITWEPVYPWGFPGSFSDLVNIYKIAYPAIHAGDPKAVVLGPTGTGVGPDSVAWNKSLTDLGLNKYIDGVSIHAYFTMMEGSDPTVSELPEVSHGKGNMVDGIRALYALYPGKPFYGTEQGFNSNAQEPKELLQAESLIRENLITLGEGYRLNLAFYIADFPTNQTFGYFYNLDPNQNFGTEKIGPKPIAPAYAAQSFLLEGYRSNGPVAKLPSGVYGYVFQRQDKVVLALWNSQSANTTLTLPAGAGPVDVYDWMGNGTVLIPANHQVTVTLSPTPIYVVGTTSSLLKSW